MAIIVTESLVLGNNPVGFCKIVTGTVRAISEDGDRRVMEPGSPVYQDERILTGQYGVVSIEFTDPAHTRLDLGRMSEIKLTDDMLSSIFGEGGAVHEEIQQLHDALLSGDIDPTTDLEPAAAGVTIAGGGGIHYVQFESTQLEVVPHQVEAETTAGYAPLFLIADPSTLLTDAVALTPPPGISFSGRANEADSFPQQSVFTDTPYAGATGDPAPVVTPQNAILVDSEAGQLVADLRVSFDDNSLDFVEITPLGEGGLRVSDGDLVFENGQPLVLNGEYVYWKQLENGGWQAVVNRVESSDNSDDHGGHDDGDDHGGHDDGEDHEKPSTIELETTTDDDRILKVSITAEDLSGGSFGCLKQNGQGMGVGNPFINMDAEGSEAIRFSFENVPAAITKLEVGIDHLSGSHGHSPAEVAVWEIVTANGVTAGGEFEGRGQGSGGSSDQTLILSVDQIPTLEAGDSIRELRMSYRDPSGTEGGAEVCGQGYRISSIKGFEYNENDGGQAEPFIELFSHTLAKSGHGEDDSSSHDHTVSGSDSADPDDSIYTEVALITVLPEMDSSGKYTGNYLVMQENEFHDNRFSIGLSGEGGGKVYEKEFTDGEMTLVLSGTDHKHGHDMDSAEESAAVVKSNGQGMGVGNPFINMDSQGSEILHFVFLDNEGESLDLREVTLGIDHLSEATGGKEQEFGKWEAYIFDESGNKVLVGSDVFGGEGQGSGWKSDQELTIRVYDDNCSPLYFNALDLMMAESHEYPESNTKAVGHDDSSHLATATAHADSSDEQHGDGESGNHDSDDDEACGNGYRISFVEGVFNPGDHTFTFEATVLDGAQHDTVATFDVTIDGDGNVSGTSQDEVIAGGPGNDYLSGGDGDDIIVAGAGDDVLIGGNGSDILVGGNGEDILIGGTGSDDITGDSTHTSDNASDIFWDQEVASQEVVDFDSYPDGDIVSEDPLEHLLPGQIIV